MADSLQQGCVSHPSTSSWPVRSDQARPAHPITYNRLGRPLRSVGSPSGAVRPPQKDIVASPPVEEDQPSDATGSISCLAAYDGLVAASIHAAGPKPIRRSLPVLTRFILRPRYRYKTVPPTRRVAFANTTMERGSVDPVPLASPCPSMSLPPGRGNAIICNPASIYAGDIRPTPRSYQSPLRAFDSWLHLRLIHVRSKPLSSWLFLSAQGLWQTLPSSLSPLADKCHRWERGAPVQIHQDALGDKIISMRHLRETRTEINMGRSTRATPSHSSVWATVVVPRSWRFLAYLIAHLGQAKSTRTRLSQWNDRLAAATALLHRTIRPQPSRGRSASSTRLLAGPIPTNFWKKWTSCPAYLSAASSTVTVVKVPGVL
ncbi:hypothetical protein LZ31DRAFT_38563 [Colletotrichum somersetense]|nr:hypothetical protein LZ31DRAFT_38563 [Colletotrichum somersetense]